MKLEVSKYFSFCRYYELDPSQTLKENLEGKAIIEFPVICVILKDHKDGYDIITPGILKSIVHHVYFLKLDVQQQ